MGASLTATFKLIDQMSDGLAKIGNMGGEAMQKVESLGNGIDSAMDSAAKSTSQVAVSLSKLSGTSSEAVSRSRQLADAMLGEAEKTQRTSAAAKEKADIARSMAQASREYADRLKKEFEASEKATDEMKQAAKAADQEASKLEKAAQKAEKRAKSAEAVAAAAKNTADRLKSAADAEEKFAEAMDKSADKCGKAENALDSAENAEKQFAASVNKSVEAEEKFAEAMDKSADKCDKAENALDSAENAEKQFAASVNKSTEAEEKFSSASGKAADTAKKTQKSLAGAEKEFKEYGESARKAGKENEDFGKKGSDAISKLESLLTGAGIAVALKKIAQEFLNCSNAASQFESSMAKVSTIADPSVSMSTIQSDITGLSKDTGKNVTDLSEAAYQAISASVDTADAVDFVDKANMLAVGGFTKQATAADVLTTAINAYSMEVSEAEKVSDMLITTQNLGKTTVDELAQNMGRVIPLAAAYNVEMDDLSTGYAIMTKNGIATAESTTYIKSMLNELGDTSSEVAKVLNEQTGQTFAQLMEHGYSLGDVLQLVGTSVNNDTTAFNNLWGSQEAGIGALSLFNAGAQEFNGTLTQMQDSAGATEKAYGKMSNTTEHSAELMKNSFNNLEIAVGRKLNPVMNNLYESGAEVIDMFTGIVEKNPAVVAGITAAGTALGVCTAAIGGYVVVTKVAIPAAQALTAAMSANPFFAVVTAITAVTSAIAVFNEVIDSNKVEPYNGTLEECQNEISMVQQQYDSVCRSYGANSQAAESLAKQLDTLNAQYEQGGGLIEDYAQRIEEAKTGLSTMQTEVSDAFKAIDNTNDSGMTAISMLESLSQRSQLTNADLDMMSKYADYLNDTFNCNIEVNYDTGKLTGFNPENLTDKVIELSSENRKQAAMDNLANADYQNQYIDALKTYKSMEEEYDRIEAELKKAATDPSYVNESNESLMDEFQALPKEISEIEAEIATYNTLWFENASIIDDSGALYYSLISSLESAADGFDELSDSAQETNEALTSEEAVSEVWEANKQQIEELAKAYEEARTSIRADLDGMFGIFEKAEMKLNETLSLDKAVSNIESQIDYFKQYREAVDQLSELGIDNNILAQLDPEQAVKFAQELGGMNVSDAKGKVDELNKSFENLSQVKDTVADKMADVEKEFSQKMNEIRDGMGKSLDEMAKDMDISSDAARSARSTMNGYINQIKSGGRQAVSEAQSISQQISNALNSVSSVSITPKVSNFAQRIKIGKNLMASHGYATGTLDAAPGLALVGEEGPELVNFGGGEVVYTADETEKILNNYTNINTDNITDVKILPQFERLVNSYCDLRNAEPDMYGNILNPDRDTSVRINSEPADPHIFVKPETEGYINKSLEDKPQSREISLNINGSGSISIKSSMDKEQVIDILFKYMKPVLMDIVEQDIFEEGEGEYGQW